MSWAAPRTWIVNEVVTAALLNTHVRDDLLESAPALFATKGDLVAATAANAGAVVAAQAATGALLIEDTGQSTGWATSKPKIRQYKSFASNAFQGSTAQGNNATIDRYTMTQAGAGGAGGGNDGFMELDFLLADHDDASTVIVKLHWSQQSTGAGNVIFQYGTELIASGEVLTNLGTPSQTAAIAAPTTAYQKVITTIVTIGGGAYQDEVLSVNVGRQGADAADTLADTIDIYGVEIVYDGVVRTS